MKKGLTLLLILVLSLSLLSGCGKKDTDVLSQIKEKGVLVIGTSADYPPYEFHTLVNGVDSIEGFDISIARALAESLGVKLEIIDMSFDGLLAALKSGKVDMVIAGMTPTEERAKEVAFSKIYYQATHTVVVKADATAPTEWTELEGKIIGVQKSTVQVDVAKENVPNAAEFKELNKIPDLILMLQSGKADALVLEEPVAKAYVKNNPDLAIAPLSAVDSEGGSAIAINLGNDQFLTDINTVLDKLLSDGTVSTYFADAIELAATLNE